MNQTSPTQDTFVDIDNARMDEQRQVMNAIISNHECPFCPANLRKYHPKPILKESQHWIITENAWPYEHTKIHLLAILKSHAETLQELPAGAGEELFQLLSWVEKEYQVPGGGVAMRFGDTRYSAGTVLHLHAQFIQPDIQKPDFQPVRVKLGKDKEKK